MFLPLVLHKEDDEMINSLINLAVIYEQTNSSYKIEKIMTKHD